MACWLHCITDIFNQSHLHTGTDGNWQCPGPMGKISSGHPQWTKVMIQLSRVYSLYLSSIRFLLSSSLHLSAASDCGAMVPISHCSNVIQDNILGFFILPLGTSVTFPGLSFVSKQPQQNLLSQWSPSVAIWIISTTDLAQHNGSH